MIDLPHEPLVLDGLRTPRTAPPEPTGPPVPPVPPEEPQDHRWARVGALREWSLEQWRLLGTALLIVLVGTIAGAAAGLLTGPTYAAEADVLYPVTTSQPSGSLLHDDRSLTTQVVLIRSHTVLDPVLAAHGLTFAQLSRDVTAEVVDGSDVLRVQVRDRSRADGVTLVDAIVTSYLRVAADPRRQQTADYLNAQLADVRKQSAGPPANTAAAAALAARQQSLLGQLDQLHVAAIADLSPRVLVAPYSLDDPVGLTPGLSALAGALTGVLAAAALVALTVRRRG